MSEVESVPMREDENTVTKNDEEVVQALQQEIERLKQVFEEQMKNASDEHKQAIAALIQEKESLENELQSQQRQNQDLVTEIQTLLEMNNQRESHVAETSHEEQALLHQYQKQIQELTSELAALQSNLDDTTAALCQVNENTAMQGQRHREELEQQLAKTATLELTLTHTKEEHARAITEVEESTSKKLAEMEQVVQVVKTELEMKEVEFDERLQAEIAARAQSNNIVNDAQSELVLNTSTASSYVTSDDVPRRDGYEEDEDDIDDHVNLAAAVITMANNDDNLLTEGLHDDDDDDDDDEEPVIRANNVEVIDLVEDSDTKKEQITTTGVIDLVKTDTEEELSDDWGDEGWGEDEE